MSFVGTWNGYLTECRDIIHLLKTELRISGFQHFHWLAGYRLSVHITAVPNMGNERVNNKAS